MSPTLHTTLHWIWNGARAREVVEVALDSGLVAGLEAAPEASLAALAERHRMRPERLYKLLDALESLGLVERTPAFAEASAARYRLAEGAAEALAQVCGRENDRERYPWRALHGQLAAVLGGAPGVPREGFAWPPATAEQTERFEASMVAGLGPIVASFEAHAARLFADRPDRPLRVLDVGGGDGTLARWIAETHPHVHVDVLNLAAVRPLFERVRAESPARERLGFVTLDFLAEPLPAGYDVVTFVRVLHDWPAEVAERLLAGAAAALAPGGRVVVCEEFRTPERLAAQFFWTYFLIGVDGCGSRLREAGAYVAWLTRLGLEDVAVLPGAHDLVVGARAASPVESPSRPR